MIQFYPRGIQNVSCHQNAPSNVDYISVYVKLLSTSREVQAMYSFSMWAWNTKLWLKLFMNDHTSKLHTYTPCSTWGAATFMKKSDLDNSTYLYDDALKIMCTLFVKLPPPSRFGCGFHTDSYAPPNLPRQPTVRIYCEAAKDLSLTVRKGVVVLAPADSSDRYQHWIKDMSYGDSVTDSFGYPAFALVNSVTGEALKTPAGENQEVSLVAYKPKSLEDFHPQPVKWSTDFIAIRIKDMHWFNMTALPSPKCENNFDGAKIVVKHWSNTPVQYWNIVPYNSNVPYKVICNH